MSTLKKIAADLGVSHTLVSRVVTGRMGNTRVSGATRQAILDRAAEVDYQPNRLALALKHGKTGVVGLFLHKVGTKGSELSQSFIHTASQILGAAGLRLWLRFFERDEEFLAACSGNLRREVDGLILAGIPHPRLIEKLTEIEGEGLPVMCALHEFSPEIPLTNVQVDHELQGYLATRHLIERGCRSIARFDCAETRTRGCLKALREAGLPIQAAIVVKLDHFDYPHGQQGIRRLLETRQPFDGLVADSDAQAAAAVNELVGREHFKRHFPKIVGFDNSPIAEDCLVPLTSVTTEMEATACYAVEAIQRKMQGESVAPKMVEPQVMVRESTLDPEAVLAGFRT